MRSTEGLPPTTSIHTFDQEHSLELQPRTPLIGLYPGNLSATCVLHHPPSSPGSSCYRHSHPESTGSSPNRGRPRRRCRRPNGATPHDCAAMHLCQALRSHCTLKLERLPLQSSQTAPPPHLHVTILLLTQTPRQNSTSSTS